MRVDVIILVLWCSLVLFCSLKRDLQSDAIAGHNIVTASRDAEI